MKNHKYAALHMKMKKRRGLKNEDDDIISI